VVCSLEMVLWAGGEEQADSIATPAIRATPSVMFSVEKVADIFTLQEVRVTFRLIWVARPVSIGWRNGTGRPEPSGVRQSSPGKAGGCLRCRSCLSALAAGSWPVRPSHLSLGWRFRGRCDRNRSRNSFAGGTSDWRGAVSRHYRAGSQRHTECDAQRRLDSEHCLTLGSWCNDIADGV